METFRPGDVPVSVTASLYAQTGPQNARGIRSAKKMGLFIVVSGRVRRRAARSTLRPYQVPSPMPSEPRYVSTATRLPRPADGLAKLSGGEPEHQAPQARIAKERTVMS